jgi:hypothetical protein
VPVVAAGNSYLLGIAKQTNEATVASVATYSLPVFDSSIEIVEDERRIEVTDAASIEGDPYKGPQSWQATVGFPAYGASLGAFLQSMWPTDTISGAGPYTHTFSALGSTQSWYALYAEYTNATNEFTFGKGLCTRAAFSATNEGGPLRAEFGYVGQAASDADFTVTTADGLANGYFELQRTGSKIELDLDTPDANPSAQPESIRNFSLEVTRDVSPEPLVDAFAVTSLSQGKVSFSGSMELLYSSWDAVKATYFGAVAGTTASSTIVYGALEMTAKHTAQAGWEFRIYIPKVRFRATLPAPDAGGSPLTIPVTFSVADPASGDHVQPVLINAVAAAY